AAKFQERPLSILYEAAQFVVQVEVLAEVSIGFGRSLGLGNDSFDLVWRQTRSRGDAHLLLALRRLVHSRDGQDAVGVDFKRNLDLRDAARRRWNADKFELAQTAISRCDLALTLQDVNFDGRLVVDHGREGQTVAQRNRRIALDNFREQSAPSFQPKAER